MTDTLKMDTADPVRGRRPRWFWPVITGAVVVVVSLAIALPLTLTGGGSTSGPGDGIHAWNQDAAAVATKLGLCADPQDYQGHTTLAVCDTAAGKVTLTIEDTEENTEYFVAIGKDRSDDCMIVAKGWVITSPSTATMAEALGDIPGFLHRYDARTDGGC